MTPAAAECFRRSRWPSSHLKGLTEGRIRRSVRSSVRSSAGLFRVVDFVDVVDTRVRGAVAYVLDCEANRARVALKERFYPAVGKISHPAPQAEFVGAAPGRFAKPDPLHASADEDVCAAAAHESPPDTAATRARSLSFTVAVLNFLAEADMRVSAAATAIGGSVSPFFARWKRTGLMRATT